MSLESEFVPYSKALALKELGFDEPCFYQYVRDFDNDGELLPIVSEINRPIIRDNNQVSICSGGDCFAAPLYQQAFRWFRGNGYKYVVNWQALYNQYWIEIWSLNNDDIERDFKHQFKSEVIYNTYEEAELECLKKLISIIKEK